jgi:D-alanyl-D-alanine carboxypeptidase (penicillin-binding protein 5/6)
MNQQAKKLGLARTKFADPAGVSPDSVSVPSELMSLGITAMKQQAILKIVRQTQVQLPVAGVAYNVDSVLGQDGIVGIKTGSGPSFGASFLFAAEILIGTYPETIYGCVMGQPTLAAAPAPLRR